MQFRFASTTHNLEKTPWILLALLGQLASTVASAQHAADNPVLTAEDAFGLQLGAESIGLYSPYSIRGFSPQVAGNVRIDGLYFDQRGPLTSRVIDESTIKVGVSSIGYAFPAPTGIVDYGLKHADRDHRAGTLIAGAGPFENRTLSFDGHVPLAQGLHLPIGAGYSIAATRPGFTSNEASFGVAPQWTPNDRLSIRVFYDWQRTSHAKTIPAVFTDGDFIPPDIGSDYYGQDWAEAKAVSRNYGGVVRATLGDRWTLAAGVFRSLFERPVIYADLYYDVQPDGTGRQLLVQARDQQVESTSGEARLTGRFLYGETYHDVTLLTRGRDAIAHYGGYDSIDVGPVRIADRRQIAPPNFSTSPRDRDDTQLWTTGLAYHGFWPGMGELTAGIQHAEYRKTVTPAGEPRTRLVDDPWRAYATLAMPLGDTATVYASYTQGLEDSGVAPNESSNRGAILPTVRTWQMDAGMRYLLTPGVKLIAGVFRLNKPYFNSDSVNVYRQLGVQRATGFEFSVAGAVTRHLNVVGGALIGHVSVLGDGLNERGIGSAALGQPNLQAAFSADYNFPKWPAFSADFSVSHFGSAPATVSNSLDQPSTTQFNLGGRYKFSILGAPATFRVRLQNLTNVQVWNVYYSPGFYRIPAPRSVLAYLTVDL